MEGIDLAQVEDIFGRAQAGRLAQEAQNLAGYGVTVAEGFIRIAPERMLTSDAVIEALFDA